MADIRNVLADLEREAVESPNLESMGLFDDRQIKCMVSAPVKGRHLTTWFVDTEKKTRRELLAYFNQPTNEDVAVRIAAAFNQMPYGGLMGAHGIRPHTMTAGRVLMETARNLEGLQKVLQGIAAQHREQEAELARYKRMVWAAVDFADLIAEKQTMRDEARAGG